MDHELVVMFENLLTSLGSLRSSPLLFFGNFYGLKFHI